VDAIGWLLESDPALRWQTMRDVADAPPAAIAAERARVPREGIGAEVLARQQTNGAWHRPGAPLWLTTLGTMLLLRATGVDRADPAVASAVARLEAGFRWDEEFGAKPFFEGEVEPCINGGALALGAYFGRPAETLARRLVGEQLDDGGWNCEAPKSARSSFNTTICVLEGLLAYEPPGRRRRPRRPDGEARSICSHGGSSDGSRPVRSRISRFSSSRSRPVIGTTSSVRSTSSETTAERRTWVRGRP